MSPAAPAIIVHGGAGPVRDGSLERRLEGCDAAARAGWRLLERGASALDVVEAAVAALEDNPLFNAGTGSTLNSRGEIEMDAAIMEGVSLRAGAVAAVQRIKNPVKLARRVLEDGRHVLLAGAGALEFARAAGIPQCPPEELVVESEQRRWRDKHGTVGAVALDRGGAVAAATSTGGIFDKLPGRVGDSSLPGCGVYADEDGGVSCTGHGESIIRVVLAKSALDFVRAGCDPEEAARRAVELLASRTGGTGGVIILDRRGRIGYARNTPHMPVCYSTGAGGFKVDF
ncbi:MAG TPA: isoaspartyl peptidase/L-asparaginase family protein [candidate division Zixibacteria bacterium]|nr:isoaspartyl peptidase/L-asparaginase family protein [candidate division Zixibacteria bacterium]